MVTIVDSFLIQKAICPSARLVTIYHGILNNNKCETPDTIGTDDRERVRTF
jgi:hypothetical protein